MSNDFYANKETEAKDDIIFNEKRNEIIENAKKLWVIEKIESSIYNTANEFIKDIENYKII
jgi:hypothetical protein